MWFSFWKSRDRFSLEELRYLTDQIQKIQVVNSVNKDFVIEALRSIAELITYGDQHDPNIFDFFMERQVMGEFVRILNANRTVAVSLQLLQTLSIIIQNVKAEHAIYYMFSNEHINFLIMYAFDFRNEELLYYYISFLRAISGKLNKNTISLLVKTHNEEVISFPLYVEGIRFAFHEEHMVQTAVRSLTLNVYHVGDESVNRFVAKAPHSEYFLKLITFFRKQCIHLSGLVFDESHKRSGNDLTSTIGAATDQIEDNLYYFSDVISAGIPDIGMLITDSFLQLLIFPVLFPSFRLDFGHEKKICVITSLYLLCSILRIVKIKDLANCIAAALFCLPESFVADSEVKLNGYMSDHGFIRETQCIGSENGAELVGSSSVGIPMASSPSSSSYSQVHPEETITEKVFSQSRYSLRDILIYYIVNGDDRQVMGSLSLIATLLQTKELEESMLDALGILPQRKQHKKLLLQTLVGEASGEQQLFSLESKCPKYVFGREFDDYLQKLKDKYGISCLFPDVGTSPHTRNHQVIDALVSLFSRSDVSAETLWNGGWLLRQLLPHCQLEFNDLHMKVLVDSCEKCAGAVVEETRGTWADAIITVLLREWVECKKAIESSSSPRGGPKCILVAVENKKSADYLSVSSQSSSVLAGERMWELLKVFVLLHQLQIFYLGTPLPERPPIIPAADIPECSRARAAGLDFSGPKPGMELRMVDAIPCRIAFDRGKERHFSFLAVSCGTSGWILLNEQSPPRANYVVVRIVSPLAGSNPKINDKHSKWLHLRIRPSTLRVLDPAEPERLKSKSLVDGRWTLAFSDDSACKSALSMTMEEINLQSKEVERRLKPLLIMEGAVDFAHNSSPR